jgi:hypothetical protein
MNTIQIIRHTLPGLLASTTLVLAGFSMSANADDLKFKLSGDTEVPSVTTKASGDVTGNQSAFLSIAP